MLLETRLMEDKDKNILIHSITDIIQRMKVLYLKEEQKHSNQSLESGKINLKLKEENLSLIISSELLLKE